MMTRSFQRSWYQMYYVVLQHREYLFKIGNTRRYVTYGRIINGSKNWNNDFHIQEYGFLISNQLKNSQIDSIFDTQTLIRSRQQNKNDFIHWNETVPFTINVKKEDEKKKFKRELLSLFNGFTCEHVKLCSCVWWKLINVVEWLVITPK